MTQLNSIQEWLFPKETLQYLLSISLKNKMPIKYQKATFDDNTVKQLLELSEMWVDEDCSFGMVANQKDDLHEPCYIALDGDKIVGYIFGKYFTEEKKTSYIEIGDKCFEVLELYVVPSYRSQGIGRTLFSLLENEVKDNVKYIVLATSTKDYQRTLKFYVKDNEMTYHSAYLIKETK